MAKVGILALQGAFIEHKKILESLGAECVEIRQKKDLKDLAGIVLPGGESTVQGQLLHKLDLFTPVQEKILSGLPVLATCAQSFSEHAQSLYLASCAGSARLPAFPVS